MRNADDPTQLVLRLHRTAAELIGLKDHARSFESALRGLGLLLQPIRNSAARELERRRREVEAGLGDHLDAAERLEASFRELGDAVARDHQLAAGFRELETLVAFARGTLVGLAPLLERLAREPDADSVHELLTAIERAGSLGGMCERVERRFAALLAQVPGRTRL